MSITVHPFFVEHQAEVRCGYVVANPESQTCAIIDAPASAAEADTRPTSCADQMLAWVSAHDFVVRWVIETHVQEQGATATGYLREKLLCAQTAAAASSDRPEVFDRQLKHMDTLCLGHACARVLCREDFPGEIALQFDNKLFISGLSGVESWLKTPQFGLCAASRVFFSRLGRSSGITSYCSALSPAIACGNRA
ncbi:MAG: hypothetical protein NXH95_01340 [Pseudomonadaceae bacterium]|nr:hypothetical protein [Pseudomonadaceae bacterium]